LQRLTKHCASSHADGEALDRRFAQEEHQGYRPGIADLPFLDGTPDFANVHLDASDLLLSKLLAAAVCFIDL
jgi:hypothetical protein